MRRFLTLGAGLLLACPAFATAQSSQFATRGLGYPTPSYSARARAMGGATALFDAESGMNPAAIGALGEMTAGFSIVNDARNVSGPGGNGATKGMRFPLFTIASPARRIPFYFGVSASTYLSRDFGATFRDTITIRGVPTEVLDTLAGQGGVNDLRGVVAWRRDPRTVFGAGIHMFSGVTRLQRARAFSDSGYTNINERAEVSAAGVGFDLGVIRRVGSRLSLAGELRSDGHLGFERDSLSALDFNVDLPISLAAGAQYRAGRRWLVAGQARFTGWHAADADLVAQGAPGAVNTWELGAGAEYVRNLDRPYRLPLRFGLRHAKLPFPLTGSDQPKETLASLGTGILFAQGMGGADFSFERAWRSDGNKFSEHAWLFSVTASIRPNRRTR